MKLEKQKEVKTENKNRHMEQILKILIVLDALAFTYGFILMTGIFPKFLQFLVPHNAGLGYVLFLGLIIFILTCAIILLLFVQVVRESTSIDNNKNSKIKIFVYLAFIVLLILALLYH
ncbi:hypothetical protein ACFL22_00185 [Patescibacteria group bacterium]